MNCVAFPVIDPVATGENIQRLRRERGLSVRDLQAFFGFEEPQAIYKWQRGKSLPSVDNLYALSALLDVPMDDIIVSRTIQLNRYHDEQQAAACCSAFVSVEQQKAADRFPICGFLLFSGPLWPRERNQPVLRCAIHHFPRSGEKALHQISIINAALHGRNHGAQGQAVLPTVCRRTYCSLLRYVPLCSFSHLFQRRYSGKTRSTSA